MNERPSEPAPIKSLSESELATAVQELTARHNGAVDSSNSREILSDCISSLGGLFAQPTVVTCERHHYFFRTTRGRIHIVSAIPSTDEIG